MRRLRLVATLLALVLTWLVPAGARAAEAPAATIDVGVFVVSIHDLDLAKGGWRVRFYLFAKLRDPDLDLLSNLEILGHDVHRDALTRMQLLDGSTFTAIRIETSIGDEFDLRTFPFDRHTLRLGFEFTSTAERLRIRPNQADSRIADFVRLQGWQVTDLRLQERLVAYDTSFGHHPAGIRPTFSRGVLEIDIARDRSAMVIDQFPGLTVGLLISFLVYLVRWDQLGVRVGMVTSAIFATVGNIYTLNSLVGGHVAFGLVHQISAIVFASILLSLSASLLVFHWGSKHGPAAAWRVDLTTGSIAVLLFTGLAVLAILHALG